MRFPRRAGLLSHISSLPGGFGCGDLGPSSKQFVEFLAKSGLSHWQVLPLGPTARGNSPYSSYSAFAGNPTLISPEGLIADGLLKSADVKHLPELPTTRVDYASVDAMKNALLRKGYANFGDRHALAGEFAAFCLAQQWWLDDFALFMALLKNFNEPNWSLWPLELVHRVPEALAQWTVKLGEEIRFEKFIQFIFWRQWQQMKSFANANHVSIIGDLPIFVAYESADVWASQSCFQLDPDGKRTFVAGVPPDYFSATGQLWGNPLYRWDALAETGYQWWVQRLRHSFQLYDSLRIDHFRGFEAYWSVPAEAETAIDGQWVTGPGADMFRAAEQALGELPIIAEDLGMISDAVHALRDELGYPGMRVFQFAFDDDLGVYHRPDHYPEHSVAYTGTHDNETLLGWYHSRQDRIEPENDRLANYLGEFEGAAHWEIMRLVLESAADTAIIPVQDILGLGNEARMNVPGVPDGNWIWRFEADGLTDELASQLRQLIDASNRLSK